jgi:hypothetical protein
VQLGGDPPTLRRRRYRPLNVPRRYSHNNPANPSCANTRRGETAGLDPATGALTVRWCCLRLDAPTGPARCRARSRTHRGRSSGDRPFRRSL